MDDRQLPTRKGKTIKGDAGNLDYTLDTALVTAVAHRGRPSVYPDTPEGLERFTENTMLFFDDVRQKNLVNEIKIIPDIELWMVYLGITRQSLFRYSHRGGEWAERIEYYKTIILAAKKQLMLSGRIPPVFAVFDTVNNSDYRNTSEFRLQNDVTKEDAKNTIDDEIRNAGMVWDPVTKELIPAEEVS